jgi:hypothetical protein
MKRKEESWKKRGRREEAERKRSEANPNPNRGKKRAEQSHDPFYPQVLLHMPNPRTFSQSHDARFPTNQRSRKQFDPQKVEQTEKAKKGKISAAELSRCKAKPRGQIFPSPRHEAWSCLTPTAQFHGFDQQCICAPEKAHSSVTIKL